MKLDVISDTVCPWCYIGKKRLERALAESGRTDVEITWRPFRLDPTIPPEGVDRKAYIERKFGPDRAKAAGETIRETGAQDGIDFAFDKIERSPNTIDSHRLIQWAGTAGVQDEVVNLLFKRYFEEGADIGNHDVLLGVAEEAGMDANLVRDLLASDADVKRVEYEDYQARQMGITGVPCFLFEGKFAITGAQDVETLIRVFDRVEMKIKEEAAG
ncbi:DsbA family oxidoreductase [Tepidicaulis sp. LMO-SS28]|uniref:DsbA family oxidoreductase n=1 Tax=Tepidicaulis sp. LMO-SS28 TaxID=3447455 RepID=UPI003EE2058D